MGKSIQFSVEQPRRQHKTTGRLCLRREVLGREHVIVLHFIRTHEETIVPASPVAIVTLVVGDDYEAIWQKAARRSWEKYAQNHQMDIIVITTPFPGAQREDGGSPAWQKCLILSQPWSDLYERIIWLDGDITINTKAPSILEVSGVPPLVSASLCNDQLSVAEKHILIERRFRRIISSAEASDTWGAIQNSIYSKHGLETSLTDMVNTGVMVLSPRHHRELLETVFLEPEAGYRSHEQAYLSHALLTNGILHVLSPRFNWGLWDSAMLFNVALLDKRLIGVDFIKHIPFIRCELEKAYFLHFNQMFHVMKLLSL